MKTLKKKIASIEKELANIEELIIPGLQINFDYLRATYKGAEDPEEEAEWLGKMGKVSEELFAERGTVLLLRMRLKKLRLYLTPRKRIRKPCGRC